MDELISRQEAIDLKYIVKNINGVDYVMLSEVQMKLRKMPSAQPERKKGKWIRKGEWIWTCSECENNNVYAYRPDEGMTPTILQDFFCPNCGADMRGELDE